MSSDNRVTMKQLMDLKEIQRCKCALTGRALTPENVSLDHINPMSTHGKHNNVHLVTREVNTAKNTMTMDDFIQMCRDVVATADKNNNGTPEDTLTIPSGELSL